MGLRCPIVNVLTGPLMVVLGVLVVAGGAKLRSPSPTAAALEVLRFPKPLLAARLMGFVEVVLGIGAALTGEPALYGLVALSYGGFAAFILWALNGNEADISCGCFGHEDTPPTAGHAAFNAAAATIAALAIFNPVSLADFDGTVAEGVLAVIVTITAVVLCIAALTVIPRNLALVRGTAAPTSPTFALRSTATQPRGNS